jgi:asparagine synthase (glutamine-hydrolysing)
MDEVTRGVQKLMCGFVGYLLAYPGAAPDLDAWSELIRHRGPDQHGAFQDWPFGVGTRRLSIQDLSAAGNQPMRSTRFALAFNGEIYNHMALRARLNRDFDIQFHGRSDTETILHALEAWGAKVTLERLNGMFALAIWDRQRRELILARDPLGVKPLYYLDKAGAGFYFASELTALRPFVSRWISPEALGLYFYLGFVPAPYCLLEGARKVLPGQALLYSENGLEDIWHIVPQFWKEQRPGLTGKHQIAERLRETVKDAVRRQLLSDVPVGIFLSGGVDSSIIATLAASNRDHLASFSVRPGQLDGDRGADMDAQLASSLASDLGFNHHEVILEPSLIVEHAEELVGSLDEPVSELYFVAELLLSRCAREAGVPVVLTGHGGDEVFFGYRSYSAARRGDIYNHLPLAGPLAKTLSEWKRLAASTRENLNGLAEVWRQSPLQRYCVVAGNNIDLNSAAILSGMSPGELRQAIGDVVTSVRASLTHLPWPEKSTTADLFARMDLLLKVPEHYNMRLDRSTMSASIEARVPLQDLELLGNVLPFSYRDLTRGGLKGQLKEAFQDLVPLEVLHRPKQRFQAPMRSWIFGSLRCWTENWIAQAPLPTGPKRQLLESKDGSTHQAYKRWSLAILEAWRQRQGLDYV